MYASRLHCHSQVAVRFLNVNVGRVVLVIEDDEIIRSLITQLLEERGFRAETASNGADALEVLERLRPAVIVLDLLMPVMHGWSFMEAYAAKTDGRRIPIVVLSVNPVLPRSFNRFGVHCCLGKPFDVDDLVKAVETACRTVAA